MHVLYFLYQGKTAANVLLFGAETYENLYLKVDEVKAELHIVRGEQVRNILDLTKWRSQFGFMLFIKPTGRTIH